MSTISTDPDIYTVGGTVQAGEGVYITRPVDNELLALCRAGVYAYILTARQMGKSSLMIRTSERLRAGGVTPLIIDLTKIGAEGVSVDSWYMGLLDIVRKRLGLDVDVTEWWDAKCRGRLSPSQRFTDFFDEVVLRQTHGQIVIFIDEIDTTLSLDFRDDFFAAIRYFYTERAATPAFKRVSFVLLGVATPSDLIADPDRTPFNIGRLVVLEDWTLEDSRPLAAGFGLPPEESERVLSWVLKWTGGHPYLTQRLCYAITEQPRAGWAERDVDSLVASTFFGERSEQDNNIQFVRDMLVKRLPDPDKVAPGEVLLVYREVRRGRRVPDEERSLVKSHLKLSGVVRREEGELRVRNPIYREVFNEHWIREHLPEEQTKRQLAHLRRAARYAAGLFVAVISGLTVVAFAQRNQAVQARNQAVEARNQAEQALRQTYEAAEKLKVQIAEAERQRGMAETQKKEAEEARAEADRLTQAAQEARRKAERSADEVVALQKAQTAEAVARSQQSEERLRAQTRLYGEAYAAISNGDTEKAIAKFQELYDVYRASSDRAGMVSTLMNIATQYNEWEGDPVNKEAAVYYKRAADVASTLGDYGTAGVALTKVADIHAANDDHAQAMVAYEAALSAHQKSGNRLEEARTLVSIGEIYQEAEFKEKNPRTAIKHFERALAVLQPSNEEEREVALSIVRNLASAYGGLDERADKLKAVEYHKQAVAKHQDRLSELNAPADRIRATRMRSTQIGHLRALATLYSLLNERAAADKYYATVVDDPRLAEDPAGRSSLARAIGSIYKDTFKDRARALRYFEEALSHAKQASNNAAAEAASLMALGAFHSEAESRDAKKALDYYTQALAKYESARDTAGARRARQAMDEINKPAN